GAERAAAAAALARKLAEHVEFEERTLFPSLQETLGCDRLAGLSAELGGAATGGSHRPAGGPPAPRREPSVRKGRKP
ncbi:MAG TPA: hypothetical protein VEP68_09870, partial [Anaeromyxobacteraceae bacterium]|nr:hypothetical protein [Anaeromyxobacteraceae bacterium]